MSTLMRVLCLLLCAVMAKSQFFDPVLDDRAYLDQVEDQIQTEVDASALELIEQAKETEKVTNTYITVKLRENAFKALRTLVETEALAGGQEVNRPTSRVGRQDGSDGGGDADSDSDQGDGGDEDGGDVVNEPATTPLNGLSTAVKINQNVFQFIGEAIKTIFNSVGGKNRVRGGESSAPAAPPAPTTPPVTVPTPVLTKELPKLMKKPYPDQLMGILTLLAGDQANQKTKVESKTDPPRPFGHLFEKNGRKSNSENTAVAAYIENLQRTNPLLFPALHRGISEPQKLLDAMTRLVTGIRQEI